MRRIVIAILSLSTLAACSPYDTPADAEAAPTTTSAPSCDRACWEKIKQRQADERLYWAEVVKRQKREAEARRIARIYAYAHAIEQARLAQAAASERIGCGGPYPPCWRIYGTGTGGRGESGGDPRIWNGGCYAPVGWAGGPPCPRGTSTASGGVQFARGTWARHRGYLNAADAPVWVQNEKARIVWAGGRGCSHWSACR